MATTRGRKTTRKKKEEVVEEASKVEVVEKAEEVKVEEPKKAPVKAEPKPEPVKEELPPQPPVEESKKEEPLPELQVEVQQEEEVVVEKSVLGIGSRVLMPTGRLGTVVNINQKGYFEVKSSRNPLKTFLYAKRQLSLVE